jgi:hypothetical protein
MLCCATPGTHPYYPELCERHQPEAPAGIGLPPYAMSGGSDHPASTGGVSPGCHAPATWTREGLPDAVLETLQPGPITVSPTPTHAVLPTDSAERNRIPLCSGCLDYFPLALAAVAQLSLIANEQHNPGEPMHWARGKSTEHRDKILKHLVDSGTMDIDGTRHSTKLAWRALANLQEELEAAGGLPGRASKFPTKE